MWEASASRRVVVGGAGGIFVVCCILPVAYMLWSSISATDRMISSLDRRQAGLLLSSGALGTGTALLATLIGAPLGFVLARIRFPGRALLRVALCAPVLLPPNVVALAWVYTGGTRGWVAALAGRDLLSRWTYSPIGAVVVLSLVFFPLSMLATEVAIRRTDGRLEEAGLLVAPPRRVLTRITLALAAPAILGAALVIFVLSVSEFSVPGLLQVRVYATEVFTAFAALYDFGRAMSLALPLLLLCMGVAGGAAWLGFRSTTRRGASGARAVAFDRWRIAGAAVAYISVALAVVLPLAVLTREALGGKSLGSVVIGSGDAVVRSVTLSTVGAAAVVGVGMGLGYAMSRSGRRVRLLANVVLVTIFAVPSTIVGVGLIGLWNRAGLLGFAYGTDAMFLLAYLARFIPVAALVMAGAADTVPLCHEEAASTAGAGWLRTLALIVLPQIRLGLVACWAIVFILCFGDLGATILVAPPGEATLPIRIYTIIANTPSSHVAVLALLQAGVVLGPLAVLAAWAWRVSG